MVSDHWSRRGEAIKASVNRIKIECTTTVVQDWHNDVFGTSRSPVQHHRSVGMNQSTNPLLLVNASRWYYGADTFPLPFAILLLYLAAEFCCGFRTATVAADPNDPKCTDP